jgi:hypothetical protein
VLPKEFPLPPASSLEIPVTLCELENWACRDGGGGGIKLMAIYC